MKWLPNITKSRTFSANAKSFKLMIFLLSVVGRARVTRLDVDSPTCALAMAVNLVGKPVVNARLGTLLARILSKFYELMI